MSERTVVELVDTSNGDFAHVSREVRVNGSRVRVAADGIDIEHGPKEVTKVHLTLLPDEVRFGKG